MAKTGISIIVSKSELINIKDNALLIGFFKDKLKLAGDLKRLDDEYGNVISDYIKSNSFKAEKGEAKSIFANKGIKNIVLLGLGEDEKYNLDVLSNTTADVSKRLRDNSTESFSIFLESFNNGRFKEEEIA